MPDVPQNAGFAGTGGFSGFRAFGGFSEFFDPPNIGKCCHFRFVALGTGLACWTWHSSDCQRVPYASRVTLLCVQPMPGNASGFQRLTRYPVVGAGWKLQYETYKRWLSNLVRRDCPVSHVDTAM